MGMKVITGLIGSGKTIEMLKQCSKDRLTIVVEHRQFRDELIKQAKDLHLYVEGVTYAEFLAEFRDHLDLSRKLLGGKYFIDNVERFFDVAFGANVVRGFTCDGEEMTVTVRGKQGDFYRKDLYGL